MVETYAIQGGEPFDEPDRSKGRVLNLLRSDTSDMWSIYLNWQKIEVSWEFSAVLTNHPTPSTSTTILQHFSEVAKHMRHLCLDTLCDCIHVYEVLWEWINSYKCGMNEFQICLAFWWMVLWIKWKNCQWSHRILFEPVWMNFHLHYLEVIRHSNLKFVFHTHRWGVLQGNHQVLRFIAMRHLSEILKFHASFCCRERFAKVL